MDSVISCQCGQSYPIGAESSGVRIACSCGRMISYFPLAGTQQDDEQDDVSVRVEVRVVSMIRDGRLPPAECVLCGIDNDLRILNHYVECERPWTQDRMTSLTVVNLVPVSWSTETQVISERELVVPTPFAACDDCRRHVPRQTDYSSLRRSATFGLVLSPLVALFLDWRWGAATLVGFCAVHLLIQSRIKRTQRRLREIIGAVPEYRDLLAAYPAAEIFAVDGDTYLIRGV